MKTFLKKVARRLRPSPAGPHIYFPPELDAINSYSMSGILALRKLYQIGNDVVARGVAGDMVECGVCNGGSAASLACAARDSGRKMWLFDSFEGLPPPKQNDGEFAKEFVGECLGSEAKVMEAMALAKFPRENYFIRKGWFENSLHSPLPEQVSLLHLDGDWYDSIMICLDTFYDRVSPGGVIILDDFGHWEGCREAFYDFVAKRKIKPLLERFGHTQAFWVKERQHNREFVGKWEIP